MFNFGTSLDIWGGRTFANTPEVPTCVPPATPALAAHLVAAAGGRPLW